MPSVKDILSSSPKVEKKHMNARACEVKPLHLQIAFRKLCAEHWPGHWTGVPSKKEWNQWKNWIKHCQHHPGHVLDCVLNNWIDFAKVVSAVAGTNLVAPKPRSRAPTSGTHDRGQLLPLAEGGCQAEVCVATEEAVALRAWWIAINCKSEQASD